MHQKLLTVCNLFVRLAADFLKADYLFLAVGVVGGACSDIEQHIIQVTKYSKREQLLELLKTTGELRNSVSNRVCVCIRDVYLHH